MLKPAQSGVTLIETIVFIVVISIALVALVKVFNQNVIQSVDPAIRIQALERGQALLDDILARRFDENTPTGGVPACGSATGPACAGIGADAAFDDVGDYHGVVQTFGTGFSAAVTVTEAGSEIGLANSSARRITVVVDSPDGKSLTLSAYKVNF